MKDMKNSNYFARLNAMLVVLLLTVLGTFNAQAGQVTFIHNDVLGSPVAASDENGNRKWDENYYPYGEKRLNAPEASAKRLGYTGHRSLDNIGLVYMGARYYDPVVGRFMGVDPVEFHEANPTSFNRFAYANNSPYKYVDPDGELPFLVIWIGKELISSAVEHYTGIPLSMKGIGKKILLKGGKKASQSLATKRSADGRLRTLDGKYAYDGGRKKRISNTDHGNRRTSDTEATLYGKFDKDGNFEKWGISQDASKRYTSKELNGGFVKEYRRGPRDQILDRERKVVERFPGPKNNEPWSGIRRPKN